MKHNIFKTGFCCLAMAALMASCEDAETGLIKVTHYIDFELTDGNVVMVPIGNEEFVDPGYVAMEGTEDVTSSVIIGGDEVDGSKLGIYYRTYSATNVDGFTSSATRTIIVYNPEVSTDISGSYTVANGSYRYWISSGATVPFSGYAVNVDYVGPGIFEISDYMGGYYDARAGYGVSYRMTGYMSLNPDNTIEAMSGDVAGWGDSMESFTNGVYDPITSTITYEVGYAGSMIFYITLTKD